MRHGLNPKKDLLRHKEGIFRYGSMYPECRLLIRSLGIALAVIYNSWLLGYLLNPAVARIGLASDLGAIGEPYNWVFIGGDVVCGLLSVVLFGLLFRKQVSTVLALTGLAVFGIFTAASALLPENCSANIARCGYQSPTQVLSLHDITGAVSALGLFVGMVYTCQIARAMRHFKWYLVLLIIWSAWGAIFLLAALPSVNRLTDIATVAIIWQQVFLLTSGLLVYCIVSVLLRAAFPHEEMTNR